MITMVLKGGGADNRVEISQRIARAFFTSYFTNETNEHSPRVPPLVPMVSTHAPLNSHLAAGIPALPGTTAA